MEKENEYYEYLLVKENFKTGEQSKRTRKFSSATKCLDVGGLYINLGKGYPGCYRVVGKLIKYL